MATAARNRTSALLQFSHFYDAFFGRVFHPRIQKVVRSLGIAPAPAFGSGGTGSRSTPIRHTVR
jgi:hypothetical protein